MEVTKEMTEVNETKEVKMENPVKQEKERKGISAKNQIVASTLILTIIFLVELYLMVNYQALYIVIVVLGLIALGAVYTLASGIMLYFAECEVKRQEHLDDIIRSERASYLMVRGKFEELEEKISFLQATSKIPTEEIINAQKGIAKVIISRNKENADAIINSNDQVLERLDAIDESQNTKFTGISKDQRLKLTEMSNQTETRLHDMLMQLKDMEIRLNQAIMQTGGKPVMSAPEQMMYESPRNIETPVFEEAAEQTVVENILEDILEDGVLDDYVVEGATEEEVVEEIIEDILEDGVLDNFVVAEEPAAPEVDLSDPNKAMSPDEIAALFASITGDAEEEPVEEVVEEEIPPMPDLSDPNRQLSPDEIAALIANL